MHTDKFYAPSYTHTRKACAGAWRTRHTFLRHDSYIACHELLRLPIEKVVSELAADLSGIKGQLHEEVLTEVIAAVKRAPTLSHAEQTQIADALSRQAAGGD